jgi:hypothetical protein
MTNFEVTKVGRTETDKKTEYSVKLEGESGSISYTLTLKSEFKSDLEHIVPLIIGESRDISILDPNRKLSEFIPEEKPVLTTDKVDLEYSKEPVQKEAGNEVPESLDDITTNAKIPKFRDEDLL